MAEGGEKRTACTISLERGDIEIASRIAEKRGYHFHGKPSLSGAVQWLLRREGQRMENLDRRRAGRISSTNSQAVGTETRAKAGTAAPPRKRRDAAKARG